VRFGGSTALSYRVTELSAKI